MASSSVTTMHEGLAIVTGAGWLTNFHIRCLEATCLYLCRESRRQLGRMVRVEASTPRSLWRGGGSSSGNGSSSSSSADGDIPHKRSAVPGPAAGAGDRNAHKFSWHSSSSSSSSSSSGRGTSAPAAPAGAAPAPPPPTTATATATAAVAPMPPHASLHGGVPSRVPSIRCTRIDWTLPATELLSPDFLWPRGVKDLRFGALFQDSIARLALPEALESLAFGYHFNRSLGPGCVRWPRGLKRLKLGATWNRLLIGARDGWPASLEVLEFGTRFNKPLRGGDGIGFPPGLREIDLGGVFNQPLAGVEWPSGLRGLTLSEYFNQPLEFRGDGAGGCGNGDGDGVSFPDGLRRITFGGRFDQEVSSTAWPLGLKVLVFGDKFNRAFVPPGVGSSYTGGGSGGGDVARAPAPGSTPSGVAPPRSLALPAGLEVLVLGDGYDHPMSQGELPDGLERLVIGTAYSFVSSVRWPAGLKRLELSSKWGSGSGGGGGGGGEGNRASHWLTLPPRLEYLDVGDSFNSPLEKIAFPATLKVLVLGPAFNHPIDHHHAPTPDPLLAGATPEREPRAPRPEEALAARWGARPPPILPDGLEELRLGAAFDRDIDGARLPKRLKRLVFALDSRFDRAVAGVAWPPGLEELRFGNCFDQRLEAGGGGGHLEGEGGDGFDGGGAGAGTDLDAGLTLPAGLLELSFGWLFSHSLQGLVLPRGLRRLSFAAPYPLFHVRGLEWPPSLRSVVVGPLTLRSREEVFKRACRPPF